MSLAALILGASSVPAAANILIPVSIIFGLMSFFFIWIFPVVVLLEATVLHLWVKLSPKNSLAASLMMNAFSTFVGVLLIPLIGLPIEMMLTDFFGVPSLFMMTRARDLRLLLIFGFLFAWIAISALNTFLEYWILRRSRFRDAKGLLTCLAIANLLSGVPTLAPFAMDRWNAFAG